MKCQECGAKISSKDTSCPACGKKVDLTKNAKIVTMVSYALFIITLLLTVIMFMLGPGSGLGNRVIWLIIGLCVIVDLIFSFAVKGVKKLPKILIIIAVLLALRMMMGGL